MIDHTGNALFHRYRRLGQRCGPLDESAGRTAARRSSRRAQGLVCFGCSAILPPGATACLACGRERPRRPSGVSHVNGVTQLLSINARTGRKFDYSNHAILRDQAGAYLSFLAFTTHRKKGDVEAGRRWAAGLFKGVYGHWPSRSFDELPNNPALLTLDVERFCRTEMARYPPRTAHAARFARLPPRSACSRPS